MRGGEWMGWGEKGQVNGGRVDCGFVGGFNCSVLHESDLLPVMAWRG